MTYYAISHKAPGTSDCRLIPMKDGTIGFESPYDPKLVEALKQAIPYSDRRWDRDQKLWFVAPQHAETLADLAEKHGMGRPVVPPLPEASRPPEFDVLDQHVAKWKEDDPWDVADNVTLLLKATG